jgi:dienelactone hydrolase
MLRAFIFAFILFIGGNAMAGETVTYKDGDVTLEGYVAKAANPNAPIVMIAHQWMGLTDYEKGRADQLAAQGYNAFAIDMYGQGIRPKDQKEAGALATRYKTDPAASRKRLNAALAYAKTISGADASRIAIWGYCFGGTMALELARSGADIKSATSFHGGLSTPDPITAPGVIKAAISVQHGADDPHESKAEIEAFKKEMNAGLADWTFTEYAGAVHSFTQPMAGNDPSTGSAYNEKADKRSWQAALDFLKETL